MAIKTLAARLAIIALAALALPVFSVESVEPDHDGASGGE